MVVNLLRCSELFVVPPPSWLLVLLASFLAISLLGGHFFLNRLNVNLSTISKTKKKKLGRASIVVVFCLAMNNPKLD